MDLQEIKDALAQGKTVCWGNEGYVVYKDRLGNYLITFTPNGHTIGLTWSDGVTMNGKEDEFFIKDDRLYLLKEAVMAYAAANRAINELSNAIACTYPQGLLAAIGALAQQDPRDVSYRDFNNMLAQLKEPQ